MELEVIGGLIQKAPHNKNYKALGDNLDELNKKQTLLATYVANSDNTSHIIHNLTFDPLKDELFVYYKGILLEKDINYIENNDNKSIELTDWVIKTDEKVKFILYKNQK